MTKKTFVGLTVVALAVALTAGGLLASNMGFKLNYTLAITGGAPDIGASTLGLPDNRQTGMNDSKTLMDDIGSASVANLQRYIESANSFEVYTGRKSSPNANFSLVAGEGYFVVMQGANVNYIAVGSDDPTLGYVLNTSVAPGINANFYSYQYHQTATDSKQLMDDVGSASVANIQRYMKASNSYEVYTGRKSSPNANFTLSPGQAYFVVMNANQTYSPSHY